MTWLVVCIGLVVVWAETPRTAAGDPLIGASGDIACDPTNSGFNGGSGTTYRCKMMATSDLLVNAGVTGVLPLGDNQYEDGSLANYEQSYDPTWGRLKAITYPIVGNHEYLTASAAGYFAYFGTAAGDPQKGYYSYDLGNWHLIALNSQCSPVGGCGSGSPQESWLKADLAAHPNQCLLAYWHQPYYSSGMFGDEPAYAAFWQDLYAAHADLVLSGHDHDYERFALQDPNGVADPLGVRQFVVGTGGNNHTDWTTIQPNSEARNNDTFGVLLLGLHSGSYEWKFVPIAGLTFADSGTQACHNQPPPTATLTMPATAQSTRTPRPTRTPTLTRTPTPVPTSTPVLGSPQFRLYLPLLEK